MSNQRLSRCLLHVALSTGILWTTTVAPATAFASNQPTTGQLPVPTANTQQHALVVVGTQGADLQSEPAGSVLRYLAVGTVVTALQRSADSQWIYVQSGDTTGWIATDRLVAYHLSQLPVAADSQEDEPTLPSANVTTSATVTSTEPITTAVVTVTNASPTEVSPTITSGASATVTVASEQSAVQATVQAQGLNVRSGPGVGYGVLTEVRQQEVYPVLGRNQRGDWLQIELADTQGWVASQFVQVNSPISQLPIVTVANSQPAAVAPAPDASAPVATASSASEARNVTSAQPAPPEAASLTGLQGSLVLQTAAGGPFYHYNLATGALRQLSTGYDPEISPDGNQVVFVRDGLYVINRDGSGEQQIFAERSGLSSPKWSPDGQWIVFSRADGEYKCRALQGGLCPSEQQLFPKPSAPGPDASPQEVAAHEQLLEARADMLNQFDWQTHAEWSLARVRADGQEYRDLAALNSARAPDWNTGGIVYQSSGGGLQKTTDQPDGVTTPILVQVNKSWQDPDWAPNNGRIVFQSKQGSHWEIFSVNPDGSGLVALTRPQTALVQALPSNVAPAWSPDGQQIVFLSNREANHEAGKWRLWVMNADGSNQRPLPLELPLVYNGGEQMVSWGL